MQENDERYAESLAYLKSLRSRQVALPITWDSVDPGNHGDNRYDLVIGVITMNRDNGGTSAYNLNDGGNQARQPAVSMELGYLSQTVVSLIKMLSHNKDHATSVFRRNKFFVCNVDPVPRNYRDPDEIKDVVETVTRYDNISAIRSNRAYHSQDIFQREKDDYIYCLEQAVAIGTATTEASAPRHVMLVEDDVVMDQRALDVLADVLRRQPRDIDDSGTSLSEREDKWLFIKLYYPEKWLGYANELDRVVELVCVGAVGGSLGLLVAGALSVEFRSSFSTRRLRFHAIALFLTIAAYTVLLCLGLGRPHARAWRSFFGGGLHRVVPAPDCCTQAVLYPARVVDGLVRHLADQRCTIDYSIDIAVAGYARMRKLETYLVDPNVVRHIGLVSSVRQYGKRISDFIT